MFPVLFKIGQVDFTSLGVLVGIGFFIAFFIIWRRLKDLGLNQDKVVDSYLFASLTALLLGRLFFILFHFSDFSFQLTRWVLINRFPGFSVEGVLLGFLASIFYLSRKQNWKVYRVLDELVFGLAPFSILVYLGMFLDGSVRGGETSFFWGVIFPGDLIRRHPVSLIYAGLFLILWLYLLKIEKRWRSWEWYKSKKEGFLILNFILFSALVNFLLAFLEPAGLYSSQVRKFLSLIIGLVALGAIYKFSARDLKEDLLRIKSKVSSFSDREDKKNGD